MQGYFFKIDHDWFCPYPPQLYSKEPIILYSSSTVDTSPDGTDQVGVEVRLWSYIREVLG
jgi:hypothetical protein